MLAQNIHITVYAKPEEDKEKIKEALIRILPFDLEENKIVIKEKKAKGFNERELTILEINLENQKSINKFLEHLNESLSDEVKELMFKQLDSRVDDDCKFYLRFSKEKLLNNEYYLTDQGNCFHIKMTIATFPKKKEKAIEIIRNIFKQKEVK